MSKLGPHSHLNGNWYLKVKANSIKPNIKLNFNCFLVSFGLCITKKAQINKGQNIGKAKLILNRDVKLCILMSWGVGFDGDHHRIGDLR